MPWICAAGFWSWHIVEWLCPMAMSGYAQAVLWISEVWAELDASLIASSFQFCGIATRILAFQKSTQTCRSDYWAGWWGPVSRWCNWWESIQWVRRGWALSRRHHSTLKGLRDLKCKSLDVNSCETIKVDVIMDSESDQDEHKDFVSKNNFLFSNKSFNYK